MNRLRLKSFRRPSVFAGFALAAALAIPGVQASGEQCTPQWPMVVWHADPAHEAVIAWTTLAEGTTSIVHYDTVSHAGDVDAYASTNEVVTTAEYTEGGHFFHHAAIADLEPSTTYYFVVETDGEVSEERWFVSGPEDDRPVRLLYGGDSRSDSENRRGMNQRIATIVQDDPDTIALVHGGDYINDGDSWDEWAEWLEDYQQVITADGRLLPIVPARGNHEAGGEVYNEVFGFPGGAQNNYWTLAIGPQIRFMQLDSNVSQGGDQRDFLEQELEAAQSSRWILANYHRPAYPAVKSPGDALVQWVPLFEQYNADLICESDGHVLKRTVPIRNGQMDPTGIVYVGEGGLGVSQRDPISEWYLEDPGMAMSGHHVQRISIGADEIVYEAILMDGEIVDTYSIMPRRDGTVTAPEFVAAAADTADTVEIELSKDMDPDRFADPDAYEIDGVTVQSVEVIDDRAAILTTDPLPQGDHLLAGNDLTDLAGNAVDGTIEFTVAPGDPPEGGESSGGDGDEESDGGDEPEDEPPPADTDGEDPTASAGTDDADAGGCGCRHEPGAPPAFLLLGLVALMRRRTRAGARERLRR